MYGNPFSSSDVIWTNHLHDRRAERDIAESEIDKALDNGRWEAHRGDWRVTLEDLVVIVSSDGVAKTVFRRGGL